MSDRSASLTTPARIAGSKPRDEQTFSLKLTAEAATVDFMQLGADERENALAWGNLGALPWYQPVSRPHPQGRVLVPPILRRKLEIEAQPVWLHYYNGHINVFGRNVYDERLARARVNLADKVKTLEKKGFK